jgi:O-antigen ligase
MGSGKDTNSPRPLPGTEIRSSPSKQELAAEDSWSGLPRFQWSLTLFGLCVFTFSVVTYRLPLGEVGAAIAAFGLVLQLGKLRAPFPVWLYGAFVLWAFISSFVSPYKDIAFPKVLESLKLLVILLIIVNALRTEGQIRFYLLFFLGCFVLFPVRGTIVGGDTVFGRAIWNYIYGNPNELASLCLITLGVALGFVYSRQPRTFVRIGAGVSAVLLLVVILLTQSRGAFIGLMAGMGPAFIWSGFKRPVLLLFSAGILTVVFSMTIPAGVWERLSGIEKMTSVATIAEADTEGSAMERYEIQKVASQIFFDNPVFGIGLGAYAEANAAYAPKLGRRDSHNTYLSLASELGLPGLVLWSALVWSVLRYAYRSRQLAGSGDLATQQAWLERALLGFLVSGIFGSYATLTFPFLMLAVLWCSATLLATPPQGPAGAARSRDA